MTASAKGLDAATWAALVAQAAEVTERAAIAAHHLTGRGDEKAADQVAVE